MRHEQRFCMTMKIIAIALIELCSIQPYASAVATTSQDVVASHAVSAAPLNIHGQSQIRLADGHKPLVGGTESRAVVKKALLAGQTALLQNAQTGDEKATLNPQGAPTSTVTTAASQNLNGQSQTLLPDGRLLLLGGQESNAVVNTAFFQNAKSVVQTEVSGTLVNARAFHSSTLLPNGTVFIFGGVGNGSSALAQSELFDPAKQSFVGYSTTGLTPRAHHTATLLTDGRVLFAGGLDGQGNTLSQIDVWDYRTGQAITLAAGLKTPRSSHTATLLSDGTVLLWGGQDENGSPLNDGETIDLNGPSVRLVSRHNDARQDAVPPILAASIPQSGETGIPIDQIFS